MSEQPQSFDPRLARAYAGDADPYEGLYFVALEEARRSLDDQTVEFDGIRARGINFLAFVGSATAFLVGGATASSIERDGVFDAFVAVSAVVSFATIAAAILLLSSFRGKWRGRLRASQIIEHYINSQVPVPSKAQLYHRLASDIDEICASNAMYLQTVRRYYRALVILGAAQIICWALLVWLRA